MTQDAFEYDVALSFAGPDRETAEHCAELLRSRGISVFLDEYGSAGQGENDPIAHLVNLYSRKARCCVLFLSQHYPLKSWTEAERTEVRDRALREADEYILPVQLDDTQVPGVSGSAGYIDLRQHPMQEVVDRLAQKLERSKSYSRSLPHSHDLRSGSISSAATSPQDAPSDTE